MLLWVDCLGWVVFTRGPLSGCSRLSDGLQGREGSKGLADHCGSLTGLEVDAGCPSGAPPGLFSYPSFFPQGFSRCAGLCSWKKCTNSKHSTRSRQSVSGFLWDNLGGTRTSFLAHEGNEALSFTVGMPCRHKEIRNYWWPFF